MEIFIKQEYCESDVKFVIEQVAPLGETEEIFRAWKNLLIRNSNEWLKILRGIIYSSTTSNCETGRIWWQDLALSANGVVVCPNPKILICFIITPSRIFRQSNNLHFRSITDDKTIAFFDKKFSYQSRDTQTLKLSSPTLICNISRSRTTESQFTRTVARIRLITPSTRFRPKINPQKN